MASTPVSYAAVFNYFSSHESLLSAFHTNLSGTVNLTRSLRIYVLSSPETLCTLEA